MADSAPGEAMGRSAASRPLALVISAIGGALRLAAFGHLTAPVTGRWADFRYKAFQTGLVMVGLIGFVSLMVGLELVAANPMRDNLREVYSPQRIIIVTLKTNGLVDSCGYYTVEHDPKEWRYLNTQAGLWAEGLSTAWRSPGRYPVASADLNQRWESCMTQTHSRGHTFDWAIVPLTVEFLNAT